MSDRRRRAGPTGFSTTGNRTALGYWVPLAVTVTVATIGLAAWVWSERSDSTDEDEDRERDRETEERGQITLEDSDDSSDAIARAQAEDPGMFTRVHGALRRTPSPQQIFDGASRRVIAGVTAAGAAVGGALGSIREEGGRSGNRDFEDHSRWAEPAGPQDVSRGPAMGPPSKRQSVAIVVSAVPGGSESASIEDLSEHASILSQFPKYINPETARVFVLIYAPGLRSPSPENLSSSRPTLSVASSYDNIAREEAESPRSDDASVEAQPGQDDAESALFKTLYDQAQALVDKETMIMPFNTPNGHVHMLRHLSPEIVYIQDSLCGETGEAVQHVAGWVRQVVVVTTPEAEGDERWWQKEGVIGRRTAVVDVTQLASHFSSQ